MSAAPRPVVEARASRGLGARLASARRDARAALAALGLGPCELSLALVGDEEMRSLNREWRGKDRPTDVLAFPQAEPGEASPGGLLGDVVVSVPTALRQAAARGHGADEEIRTLLVHGILHLLGHDHERSPSDARRMFRIQREVVATISASAAAVPRARASRSGAGRARATPSPAPRRATSRRVAKRPAKR